MDPGDLIDHRYRLEEPIGSGGMAEVWRAFDTRLKRPAALKFLAARFSDDPDNLVRFFSEAQSLARIQHPNVVTVLDFGTVANRPFLVMECISGGSLADRTGRPIDPRESVDIIQAIAAAAGAAHELDIIHRDIKPGNILIAEDGSPKLADFGIASYSGAERLTVSGLAVGSPSYISPEQATDTPTTARSDVYALGVVMYEMLTGRLPFESDNLPAVVIAHVEEHPARPSTFVPDLAPELDDLVMRCLEKDPARRFSDGTDLARALSLVSKTPPLRAATATRPRPGSDGPGSQRPTGARLVLAGSLVVAAAAAFLMLGLRDDGAIRDEPSESLQHRKVPTGTPRTPGAATPAAAELTDEAPFESPPAEPNERPSPDSGVAEDDDAARDENPDDEQEPSPSPSPTQTSTPTPSPSPSPDATSVETSTEVVGADQDLNGIS